MEVLQGYRQRLGSEVSTIISSHLPFFVMIISVPTELNCFHKEAFSSSILTSSFEVLGAGSLGTGGGASSPGGRAVADTSQAAGYSGTWAAACRSAKTQLSV